MHSTLATLIDRLDRPAVAGASVIPWAAPVPVFGDLARSRVATLGLNPSNREFVDESGTELPESDRRFHTLRTLGLGSWSEAEDRHLDMIMESCRDYFCQNPYNKWFKRLDNVVAGAKASYYSPSSKACHLDLVPYATKCKWSCLRAAQQRSLTAAAGDTLGLLLRESPVRILILHGAGVVRGFQKVASTRLAVQEMPSWSLQRQPGRDVMGLAYKRLTETVSGIDLGRKILVLGFNHNIPGRYGPSNTVVDAIRDWVAQAIEQSPT